MIGTSLAHAIHEQFGVSPCKSCSTMMDRMNAWGKTGCILHIGEIIPFLLDQAKQQNVKLDAVTITRFLLNFLNKPDVAKVKIQAGNNLPPISGANK